MPDIEDLEKYLRIRRLSDIYYDVQDVRIRTASRLRIFPLKAETTYPQTLLKMEQSVKHILEADLKSVPIYEWMSKIKGIGPCLGGSLIGVIMVKFVKVETLDGVSDIQKQFALKTKNGFNVPEIRGIGKFPTVSSLWKFCGLDVVDGHAPKKRRNETITWSPKMRTTCWKIGESFVKQKSSYYRKRYEEFRKDEDGKVFICKICKKNHPKASQCIKGHRYARAKRKTVKLFIAHLFDRWYRMEGLTPPEPYHKSTKPFKPPPD